MSPVFSRALGCSPGWLLRQAACAVALCMLLPAQSLLAHGAKALDFSDTTEAQSAAQRVIEWTPEGAVRMTAPLQDLEAIIGPSGVRIQSVDEAGNASFYWQADRVGRDGAMAVLPGTGSVRIDGEVVSVTRAGIAEEFRTSADGIRQDFLIHERPEGAGDLMFDVAAHGAVISALPDSDGQAVAVTLNDGRVLHYRRLLVTDARGEVLAARMTAVEDDALRITVADQGAHYPVRIDPTFTDADWSTIGSTTQFTTSSIRAITFGGGQLYVAGNFTQGNGDIANRVAMWNGSTWSSLGAGVADGIVIGLAWDPVGNRLFAAGSFNIAGGVTVNDVAVWDGAAWSGLAGGSNSFLRAITWDSVNGLLYAVGDFTVIGGVAANRVASWNGTAWSALGAGVDSSVLAVTVDPVGGRVYVGGNFANAGGNAANRVAVWNGSAWAALGTGVDSIVFGLAWDAAGNRLYVGGAFAAAGGTPSTRYIAAWNVGTNTWTSLGGGISGNNVSALALDAATGRLFAGGSFSSAGGGSASNVAVWDGTAWEAIGSGTGNGIDAMFWEASVNRLYVGGSFTVAGGQAARVAQLQAKTAQTITFANPGAQTFGTTPTLTATASSGLTVAFTSTTTGVCTITSGGALSFVTAGTCTIDADQAGNTTFLPAATVSRSFAVNAVVPGAPTIGTATMGDTQASVAFTAPTSTGGAAVTYTVTASPGGLTGTGVGSPITVTGLTNGVAYTFTVTATNSAGTGAASAASNSVTPKAAQTITFANPGAQNFGTTPTLTATSDSALTVTFTSSTTGVCTITTGGALTFVTAGTCTINADQTGNGSYLPATQVSRSFTVNPVVPGAPTIGTATAGDTQASVAFTAPASTGGASITGYTVTSNPGGLTGTGVGSPITVTGLTNSVAYTFTVAATNSAGTGAASAASNSVTPKAAQTITFANPGAQNFGTTPTLTATSDSALTVTFTSSTTGVCTITSGGALTFVTAGTCTINADQAGDGSYLPATQVSRSFTVTAVLPGAPTISAATAGDTQATVAFIAPASNGGASITGYTVTSNPGGLTGTGAGSPITVTGLTNGVAYTFTVTATNSAGTGAASAASNSVTPQVAFGTPVLRPDRVIARENSAALEVSVLANDSIDAALANAGVLSIATAPTRGTASVLTRGTASVLDDAIRYVPAANTAGADSLVYRVCFGGLTPCVEADLSIDIRPLGVAALTFDTSTDRGFRDETLSGLRALPSARFDAHGLVGPTSSQMLITDVSTSDAPWGAGRTATVVRTLAGGATARDWRVLVDAQSIVGGDISLYLGIDSNGNGQADGSELACSAAMSAASERCDLALTAPANGTARYWVLTHAASSGEFARLEIFETALDLPAAERSLVATAPGALQAGDTFPVRLSWNDPTFLPGQSRGGWLHVLADDEASLGWVPIRINRTAGEPVAFALQSGVDYRLALGDGGAHERLFIDVPPGATELAVTTTSSGFIDVYLARVPALSANGAVPAITLAPPRSQATARGTQPSGNENVVVMNPAAGRWYVTPTNAPLANAATLTVRATITGSAPPVRSGGFFNPDRSGNGLFIYPAGTEWSALWYTFLQDGSPTWYYLQAPQPGSNGVWRSPIFRSAWDGSSNRLTAIGEATVTASSTQSFTFTYTLDGQTGSEAYSNFSGNCPNVGGAPLNVSGHWFDPTRSGTGYTVQTFPNYEFQMAFVYDARGVARSLVAEQSGAAVAGSRTLPLEQLSGACPLCERTGNPTRTVIGTLTRQIGSGVLQQVSASGSFVNGVPGTWAANDAVISLGSVRGCAAN